MTSRNGDNKARRRLKGLLALLPASATLYPYRRKENQLPVGVDEDFAITYRPNINTTKVTSRKQQRRRLKRYQQELHSIDVEHGHCDDNSNDVSTEHVVTHASMNNESVKISELVHDNDIVVLFLFDPYQPYSMQLLQKLIAVYHLSYDSQQVGATSATTTTIDEDDNVTDQSSKLHCFVVTPCTDMILIDQVLSNSGTLLLPWTSDSVDGASSSSSYWKVAMGGANVCPSILAIIECSNGRNLFSVNHEELGLDWNTSMHVFNSWFHHRTSSFTMIQRIQACTLYPTSSICSLQ